MLDCWVLIAIRQSTHKFTLTSVSIGLSLDYNFLHPRVLKTLIIKGRHAFHLFTIFFVNITSKKSYSPDKKNQDWSIPPNMLNEMKENVKLRYVRTIYTTARNEAKSILIWVIL